MGAIQLGAIAITSINMGFADLPTTAQSYDGTVRDISQFYEQDIPNVQLGGYYNKFNWTLDTGTHTDKLSTGAVSLGYTHTIPLTNTWDLTGNLTQSLSITDHSPCTDSYDRKYYCGNLTAFSDIERTQYVNNSKISLSISTRW